MPLIEAQPGALAQTYATSLFELADAQGGRDLVEAILGELEDLLELAREDARFAEFLASRVITRDVRAHSLRTILDGRISPLTLGFVLLLNDNERLAYIPAIISAFDQIVQGLFGRVEVDVITAAPIDADELASIRDRLTNAMHKDVVVHPYTDDDMIGGVKLRLGDRLIDASVATQLRKFRERLGEQGAARLRAGVDRVIREEGTHGGQNG